MDPDLPLMQALQRGDDSALNELIDRHREPLFRFVYRYLHDETIAREIVQEAFVRTYFKAHSFEPRSLVKTWIYAIALNLCRDQVRRVGRRPLSVSIDRSATEDRPALEIADPGLHPNEQMGARERFAALERAIDQLPHKLRAALVLFSIEGHSQREIAEMLGTTAKTIELRVAHAKQKLRGLLGDSPN